jgi:hypothetical protein
MIVAVVVTLLALGVAAACAFEAWIIMLLFGVIHAGWEAWPALGFWPVFAFLSIWQFLVVVARRS